MAMSSVDRFVFGVKKIWGPLSSETVVGVQSLLEELASSPDPHLWAEELLRKLDASFELYRDPEYGFVLTVYSEQEGRYRIPHDHGSGWVLYAVVAGEMVMGTYSRIISQTGALSLVRRNSTRVLPGVVQVYLPADIHDTACAKGPTVVLRFTSCDLKKEDLEGRMIRYEGRKSED